ncbi:MAG: hypothetical protein ABWZ27_00770 [Aestuariivirgaceae bacterium]|jgi:hypothetical protein
MAKQKLKLPKRLAGIKVPKPLRRSSKRFAKQLRKTGGLELLAHALVAAGTALMASPKARQAVAEAGQSVKDSGSALADLIGDKAASGASGLADTAKKKRKKDKKLSDQPYRIEEPGQRRH